MITKFQSDMSSLHQKRLRAFELLLEAREWWEWSNWDSVARRFTSKINSANREQVDVLITALIEFRERQFLARPTQ